MTKRSIDWASRIFALRVLSVTAERPNRGDWSNDSTITLKMRQMLAWVIRSCCSARSNGDVLLYANVAPTCPFVRADIDAISINIYTSRRSGRGKGPCQVWSHIQRLNLLPSKTTPLERDVQSCCNCILSSPMCVCVSVQLASQWLVIGTGEVSLYLQREIGLSTFLAAIQTFCLKVGHSSSHSDSILQATVYVQVHCPGDMWLLFCCCMLSSAVHVHWAKLLLLWLLVLLLIDIMMHKVKESWRTN